MVGFTPCLTTAIIQSLMQILESFIVLAFSMEPKILREAMVLENDCYTSGEHDGQRDLECFWGLISVAI